LLNASFSLYLAVSALRVPEKSFRRGPPAWLFAAVGAVALAFILVTYAHIWSSAYGVTRFIIIGHEFNQRGLAVYRATPKYMDPYPPDRWGFDGQHYAQLALDPLLRDSQTKQAIDNPPYRARRILMPWLAWLLGLGRPFWVLNAYAMLNPLFWIGFAVMMGWLFRPYGWAGLAGFAAMLLTCGIIESMRGSLTDFPAFVLMTLAVITGGSGGAGLLALAGLTREVNVIGLAGLLEFKPPWAEALKKNIRLGLIAVGPILLWWGYIAWRLRMHAAWDGDNLDWPMRAIGQKFAEFIVAAGHGGIAWAQFYRDYEFHALLTIIATLTQCFYLLTHREWGNRLWRMAAIFVPLFLCIGYPAWASHFTVTRHALPITLGFNLVLAMRPSRRWLLWFLLGNCFVPYGIFEFSFYGREKLPRAEYTVVGVPREDAAAFSARFGPGWLGSETGIRKIWRWADGERAILVISNAHAQSCTLRLAFDTTSPALRDLQVSVSGTVVWSGRLDYALKSVRTQEFTLPPGETVVKFETSQPPTSPGIDDPRQLTFMLSGLELIVANPPSAK